ncbi:hypothetical protein [Bacteroides sp. An322]|uniref:hypothetical protein n=1 Tax=Bacteroides sp. An322 TaxID=1965632 RepID=UPI00117CB375|nr:hypothetical protein [Bacteroides sp. An322]
MRPRIEQLMSSGGQTPPLRINGRAVFSWLDSRFHIHAFAYAINSIYRCNQLSFIFQPAECTFQPAEYTFQPVEYTFQPAECKTYLGIQE